MIGPKKIPRFPVKAKKLNARAWVFCVLFSLNIVRIVLRDRRQSLSLDSERSKAMEKKALHDSSAEDSGKATKQNHLPYRLTEAKCGCCNCYTGQGGDEDGFPPPVIRRTTPRDHKQHLGEREQRLLEDGSVNGTY